LQPQEKIVGEGVFCGVFQNATVVQNTATGEIFLHSQSEPTKRVLVTIPLSSGVGIKIRKIVDTNSDGCSDFIVENPFRASYDVWYLRATHVVRAATLPVTDFFATHFIESDYWENGKPGLFVANKTTGEIVSYVSDGMSWEAHTVHPAGLHPGLVPLAITNLNHQTTEPEFVFFNPMGAPNGHFVVVGYNVRIGFVRDPGVEECVNEALASFVEKLNRNGDWTVTVVHDPSGSYDPGYLLLLKLGLL
jgi:hypothetical protein